MWSTLDWRYSTFIKVPACCNLCCAVMNVFSICHTKHNEECARLVWSLFLRNLLLRFIINPATRTFCWHKEPQNHSVYPVWLLSAMYLVPESGRENIKSGHTRAQANIACRKTVCVTQRTSAHSDGKYKAHSCLKHLNMIRAYSRVNDTSLTLHSTLGKHCVWSTAAKFYFQPSDELPNCVSYSSHNWGYNVL